MEEDRMTPEHIGPNLKDKVQRLSMYTNVQTAFLVVNFENKIVNFSTTQIPVKLLEINSHLTRLGKHPILPKQQ